MGAGIRPSGVGGLRRWWRRGSGAEEEGALEVTGGEVTVWAGEPEFDDDFTDVSVDALVPLELVSPAVEGRGLERAASAGPPPAPPTLGGDVRELSSVMVTGGVSAGRDVGPAVPDRPVHAAVLSAA